MGIAICADKYLGFGGLSPQVYEAFRLISNFNACIIRQIFDKISQRNYTENL